MVKIGQDISDRIAYFLLGLICLIPFITIQYSLMGYHLIWPVSGDPGEKMAIGYALFEKPNTLGSFDVWQYPPIVPIIMYTLAKATSDVFVIRWFSPFFLSILPVPMFFLGKRILQSNYYALLAAFLGGTFAIFYNMYTWGAYPNLVGLFFLPLAFIYLIKLEDEPTTRNFSIAMILCSLVIFSHHLTTLVLLATLAVYSLLLIFTRNNAKMSVFLFLFCAFLLGLYKLLTWPNQFITFNESAWYHFKPGLLVVKWTFSETFFAVLMVGLAIAGCILSYSKHKRNTLLLIAWSTAPFLFWILWGLRIFGTDSHRFPIFSLQPIILLVATSLYFISDKIKSRKIFVNESIKKRKHIEKILVVITIASLMIMSFYLGPYHYGIVWKTAKDDDAFNAVMWVKDNTSPEDVIASGGVISRWIQGIAHRRTLALADPAFMFIKGQYEESTAVELLSSANILAQNAMFRVRDQIPVHFEKTPWIEFYHEGYYESVGYLCDYFLKVNWGNGTNSLGEDFIFNTYEIDSEKIAYSVEYATPQFNITKTVDLITDDDLKITFEIKKLQNVSISSVQYSIWILPHLQPTYTDQKLFTTLGKLHITTNSIEEIFAFSEEYDAYRLLMLFRPENDILHLQITLSTENTRLSTPKRLLYTAQGILDKYNVSYFVAETEDKQTIWWLNTESTLWELVYENPTYLIYKVTKEN